MAIDAAARWRSVAAGTLIGLILLSLAWELWLAPLRPGGSSLALKALPLAFALPGILRGKRYTFQWASMLILFYFTEGVVRAWSEGGVARALAFIEIALTLIFFAAAIVYSRISRPVRSSP